MPTRPDQNEILISVLNELQKLRQQIELGGKEAAERIGAVESKMAEMATEFAVWSPIMVDVREIVAVSVSFKKGGKFMAAVARVTGRCLIYLSKAAAGLVLLWGLFKTGIVSWFPSLGVKQ